jgi:hypothetical protein
VQPVTSAEIAELLDITVMIDLLSRLRFASFGAA